jgi:uncharacterized coiled-coil DUF342 family protein
MKTKEEIQEELTELYGALQALRDAMNYLHDQQIDKSKKMFALNNMLRDMENKDE